MERGGWPFLFLWSFRSEHWAGCIMGRWRGGGGEGDFVRAIYVCACIAC